MGTGRLNIFQRLVLVFALAIAAGMAIWPLCEGLRPLGGGRFSKEPESIGRWAVFSAPPRERTTSDFYDEFSALGKIAKNEGGTAVATPPDALEESLARIKAAKSGAGTAEAKSGEPWRRVSIAWVRFGCEFAALVFITLLLLVVGQFFRKPDAPVPSGASGG